MIKIKQFCGEKQLCSLKSGGLAAMRCEINDFGRNERCFSFN